MAELYFQAVPVVLLLAAFAGFGVSIWMMYGLPVGRFYGASGFGFSLSLAMAALWLYEPPAAPGPGEFLAPVVILVAYGQGIFYLARCARRYTHVRIKEGPARC